MPIKGRSSSELCYHGSIAKPSVLIGTPFGSSFSVPYGFHKSMISLVRYTVESGKFSKVRTLGVTGADVAKNRNIIAKEARNFDYMLQIDSDMVFDKDYLLRLMDLSLKFPDGVVSGIAFLGNEPHMPAIFQEENGRHVPIGKWPAIPFPVQVVGAFGFLVHKSILIAVGSDPFTRIDGLQEDFSFCKKVALAGKSIVIDPSLELGHLRPKEIRGDDFHR